MGRKELTKIMAAVHCSHCGDRVEAKYKPVDMDYKLRATCRNCSTLVLSIEPQEVTTHKLHPKTAGVVQSCLDAGSGYAGLQKLVKGANLHSSINSFRYTQYSKAITKTMHDMYEAQRSIINRAVRRAYSKEGRHPDQDGLLDVDVSYDGSWQTRGHHSNIGAGFVIDSITGAVLDFEVKSKFCQKCVFIKKN